MQKKQGLDENDFTISETETSGQLIQVSVVVECNWKSWRLVRKTVNTWKEMSKEKKIILTPETNDYVME